MTLQRPRHARRGIPTTLIAIVVLLLTGLGSAVALPRLLPPVGPADPGSAAPDASPSAVVGANVFVGAGDVGVCDSDWDSKTGALIEPIPGTVFMLGDGAYDNGTVQEFADCYGRAWGSFRDRTYPVAGNHEWYTEKAGGYFGYFGERAGSPTRDWYSMDLAGWHIIFLDSECGHVDGCGQESAQGKWLAADLAKTDPAACVMALWHHPRWSSGHHGNDPRTEYFWRLLYANGADVVLNGHEHLYERYVPIDPNGAPDRKAGLTEFIVGTGGAPLRRIVKLNPTSAVHDSKTHGVLRLTLHADSYDWAFVPVAGSSFTDSGTGQCHGKPTNPTAGESQVPTGRQPSGTPDTLPTQD
jgi:hypothetical protein